MHLDVKKLGRIGQVGHRIHGDRTRRTWGLGGDYLHVAIDDHSRVAYGAVLPTRLAPGPPRSWARAIAWHVALDVAVERVLTDNGACSRAVPFAAMALVLGVGQHCTRPSRPQTNGKTERFLRTLPAEWAYARAYDNTHWRTHALPACLSILQHRAAPHRARGSSPSLATASLAVNNILNSSI